MARIVELAGVAKSYPPDLRVLTCVDLTLDEGEVVAVRGASGTGKSTLLNLVGLLDRADAGSLRLLGHETTGLSSPRRSALRADHLGFVFQGFHLLNEFDVLENVVMAARCARRGLTAARANARRLLTEVGLEARAHAAIATLSGGERQRAALARALLLKPRLLLADEPTGNLDPATAALVLDQMLALARGHGSAVLIVTHDTQVAGRADRRLVLRDGRLHPE